MTINLTREPVELWNADNTPKIIARQSTQDSSFSVPVQAGSSYLLFTFDEDNGNKDWTDKTLKFKFFEYFENQNTAIGNNDSVDYYINRYQLVGFANTKRVVSYTNGCNFTKGTENDPAFYSKLNGSFKLSFNIKPGVTLPSLPKNILDLFESNQIQAKVSRHFQQPYKNFSIVLVDGGFSTKYAALVVVNAISKAGDPIVIDNDNTNKPAQSLHNYIYADDSSEPFFTSVQNLGHLIKDIDAIELFSQYYNITLLGSNQMRLTESAN